MKDKVADFISELRRRRDISRYSEADTKQSVILYLLSLLGWNPFDSEEVKPEYVVGSRRVDYALRLHSVPKVFIEVKKVDENLADHEEQLVSYATTESVRMATLTNGITWWLYLPLVEGKWDQKKFYTIDIHEQDPIHAADKFIQFLSKPTTASGQAIALAEAVFKDRQKDYVISSTLPLAWNRLIEGIDDNLVQLLKETTEKLCGYEIAPETVIGFFEQHQDKLLLSRVGKPAREKGLSPTQKISHKPSSGAYEGGFLKANETTLRVVINWQKVGKSQPPEVVENGRGVRILLQVLERIANHVGKSRFQELLDLPVNRGMLLSRQRTKYNKSPLLDYYVLTYNSTAEKAGILKDVVRKFNLPPDFLVVEIVDLNP